jgi:hypothetical protein
MKYFAVLGCVTDIGDATPYMRQPATTREQAVENWYLAACSNNGIDPEAFPAVSDDHEVFLDMKAELQTKGRSIADSEIASIEEFEI